MKKYEWIIGAIIGGALLYAILRAVKAKVPVAKRIYLQFIQVTEKTYPEGKPMSDVRVIVESPFSAQGNTDENGVIGFAVTDISFPVKISGRLEFNRTVMPFTATISSEYECTAENPKKVYIVTGIKRRELLLKFYSEGKPVPATATVKYKYRYGSETLSVTADSKGIAKIKIPVDVRSITIKATYGKYSITRTYIISKDTKEVTVVIKPKVVIPVPKRKVTIEVTEQTKPVAGAEIYIYNPSKEKEKILLGKTGSDGKLVTEIPANIAEIPLLVIKDGNELFKGIVKVSDIIRIEIKQKVLSEGIISEEVHTTIGVIEE